MDQAAVRDNPASHRFELEVEGLTAFADYRRQADRLVITHVETPPALRGAGVAGRLMQGVAERARAEGVKIQPLPLRPPMAAAPSRVRRPRRLGLFARTVPGPLQPAVAEQEGDGRHGQGCGQHPRR